MYIKVCYYGNRKKHENYSKQFFNIINKKIEQNDEPSIYYSSQQ